MAKRHIWDMANFTFQDESEDPFSIETSGLLFWALRALIAAGPPDCRSNSNSRSRWRGFVEAVRAMIEENETDAGPRYALCSTVAWSAG